MAEDGADGAALRQAAIEARRLLRGARQAVLATADRGAPNAALVTQATTPELDVLVLLSGLSAHTRELRQDGRAALLVTGTATDANPQTAPRLVLRGLARPDPDPALRARWLAIHPYAAFYAGLGDFSIWRLSIDDANFVAGFARAHRLAAADLRPAPAAIAAVDGAEAGIIAHCNADHADAMAALAVSLGGAAGDWRMVAADADGCDLFRTDADPAAPVLRLDWPEPVADATGVRKALIALLQRARDGAG